VTFAGDWPNRPPQLLDQQSPRLALSSQFLPVLHGRSGLYSDRRMAQRPGAICRGAL